MPPVEVGLVFAVDGIGVLGSEVASFRICNLAEVLKDFQGREVWSEMAVAAAEGETPMRRRSTKVRLCRRVRPLQEPFAITSKVDLIGVGEVRFMGLSLGSLAVSTLAEAVSVPT